MKKLILFVTFSFFLFSSLEAQKLRLGIIASPGLTWFKTDISSVHNDGNKLGINIGLMIDNYFAEHYAFTTGISIHSLGGVLQYRSGTKELKTSSGNILLDPGNSVHYNLQYLHIPLALKFKTTEIGYSTFFAQLGLNTMINIKARATVKEQDLSAVGVGKEINLIYLGYHIGIGMEYKILGSTSLIVGLTYMNGFTDVTTDKTDKTLMHGLELKMGVIF